MNRTQRETAFFLSHIVLYLSTVTFLFIMFDWWDNPKILKVEAVILGIFLSAMTREYLKRLKKAKDAT